MYKALYLSPMIPSFEIGETTGFFTDLFLFSVVRRELNYVILSKDSLTIHILNAGVDIGEMEFYLEVDDIDSLWQNIENKLPNIKKRAPFDREYGMREFHVEIPYTKTLLFVGQALKN
jgi:hypothetical protein